MYSHLPLAAPPLRAAAGVDPFITYVLNNFAATAQASGFDTTALVGWSGPDPCVMFGVTCMGSGFPDWVSNLASLQALSFSGNARLAGTLPTALWAYQTNLASVDVSNTGVCGPNSDDAATLPALESLRSDYHLASIWDGSRPCESSWAGVLCTTENIDFVDYRYVTDIEIIGTIPPLSGGLLHLDLHNNSLWGAVPLVPADLTYLDLSRK
ncbi:hypothetical protein HXX76_012829 [Chlamydomonas incerta]|uniref:Leucine-rich repeat-containing N-terminal plant-type domain-containing protein n=1 Tax=Chlamydomonas incerta TaxID=51695 RepID=A0A835SGF9_CHLIN|nr:hypothetical protein HXX76_012829 [Chlamydomonas incerta]|eukprot:KAG2426772.1 hypothetical protein HXX76_012829 [Chlamydomonas incerta]